jgi:hypothetical protein
MTSYFFLAIRSRVSSNAMKIPFKFVYDLYALVDHLLAQNSQLIRNESNKESDYQIDKGPSPSILFVAHCVYDLAPNELDFLVQLESSGARSFIVSNCDTHLAHSLPETGRVWTRQNRGRDLAAIRDFFRANFKLIENANLCIINSSCYWSHRRLENLLKETAWADVEGVLFGTESKQGTVHFQTFFMLVSKKHLYSFARGTEHFKNWRTKRAAVIFGEYNFGKNLKKEGLTTEAIYSDDPSPLSTGFDFGRVNPSIVHAGKLLKSGAPFLKKGAATRRFLAENSDSWRDFFD